MTQSTSKGDNYGIQVSGGGSLKAESVAVGDHATIDNRHRATVAGALKEIVALKEELQRISQRVPSAEAATLACQELEEEAKRDSPNTSTIESKLVAIAGTMKAGGSVIEETITVFGYLKTIAAIFGIAMAGLGL